MGLFTSSGSLTEDVIRDVNKLTRHFVVEFSSEDSQMRDRLCSNTTDKDREELRTVFRKAVEVDTAIDTCIVAGDDADAKIKEFIRSKQGNWVAKKIEYAAERISNLNALYGPGNSLDMRMLEAR